MANQSSTQTNSSWCALIADDIDANRLLLSSYLQSMGFAVDEVDGGRPAIDMLTSKRYDLALLDWHMPGIDGLDVIREIRSAEMGGDYRTPISIVTASSVQTGRQYCLDHGADDYITKPVSVEQLTSVVRSITQIDAVAPTHAEEAAQKPHAVDQLISQLGESTVAEVIEVFLSDLDHRHLVLVSSLTDGDMNSARREAHTVKSPGYILGATCLSELCESIESGSFDTELILGQVTECFAETRKTLEKRLTDMKRVKL